MSFSVRRFVGCNGERFSVLIDEEGSPLFYPTLWVTVVLRGGARAVNTIQNALSAIKCLYSWQSVMGVDLEQRFVRGLFLIPSEIHCLRDFLQQPLSLDRDVKATNRQRRQGMVSSASHYARMSVAASYIEFLARRVSPHSEALEKQLFLMLAQIRSNRPRQSTKTSARERSQKYLDDRELDALQVMLVPGADLNPFVGHSVQLRNAIMFSVLRATGLRRGELLNLKVDDINFSTNTLRVVRRPDSAGDIRRYQPVAKTRERQFPIDGKIISLIHEYVTRSRSKITVAKYHGYLFVTHKNGPYQGRPISNSAFSKFISALEKIVTGLCAHSFRHHWNYSFSNLSTEKALSPQREEKLRSYLMGWEPTSGTAAIYNQRYIKKEAGESMLRLQDKMLNSKEGEKNDL